jgi:endo-1,4-beta-mannosidase
MNNNPVKSENGNFVFKEKPFRFIGCNMYELANVNSATTELMVRDAAGEGFTVIRFWAFEPTEINKIIEICDLAKEFNIKLIPVLADTHGFLQNYRIDTDWYKDGFKTDYLSYLGDITFSLKDRDEIMIWELINEPVTDSYADIYCFSKSASEFVRSNDPNHLISIGTIGGVGDLFGSFFSRFNSDNFKKLYSIKTLDAVSIHDYSFNSTVLERLDILFRLKGSLKSSDLLNGADRLLNAVPAAIDKYTLKKSGRIYDFPLTVRNIWKKFNAKNITAAGQLEKPVYVGEVGFKKNLKEFRKVILKSEIERYFNEGISGVLLWSFESQGRSKDGHDYGFGIEDGFGEIVKSLRESITTVKTQLTQLTN